MPVTSISRGVTSRPVNERRPIVAQDRQTSATTEMRDARYEMRWCILPLPHPASRIPQPSILQLPPELHPLGDSLFVAHVARLVPFLAPQHLRQVLLRHVRVPERVGVLIPRSIA